MASSYYIGLIDNNTNQCRMWAYHNAQKMKLSIKDTFSKCDQIRSSKRILSHLL